MKSTSVINLTITKNTKGFLYVKAHVPTIYK